MHLKEQYNKPLMVDLPLSVQTVLLYIDRFH